MTGVILFRAQPFHNGHLNMIKKAFEDSRACDADLHIFVGSADKKGTVRNPLPIEFRLMLIRGALHEVYDTEQLKHIHIHALDDLTDEADNSYAWGRYLFMKMFSETKDPDMTIYYSDNPQIMLGWFAPDERWCLRFKFLDRFENITATITRQQFLQDNKVMVKHLVPNYVYIHYDEILNYLKEATKVYAG